MADNKGVAEAAHAAGDPLMRMLAHNLLAVRDAAEAGLLCLAQLQARDVAPVEVDEEVKLPPVFMNKRNKGTSDG